MSLQDDAANCAWSDYRKDYRASNHETNRTREHKAFHAGWEAAKAELSRDYYLVPLADLPEVTDHQGPDGPHMLCGHTWVTVDKTADECEQRANEYAAIAVAKRARESEVAVLARRRDELARKLGCYPTPRHDWDGIPDSMERAIDRIIELEDQVRS